MKQPAKTFEDLLVWQKAHDFCVSCLSISERVSRA